MKHALESKFLWWVSPILWLFVICLSAMGGPLERYNILESKFQKISQTYAKLSEEPAYNQDRFPTVVAVKQSLKQLENTLAVSGRAKRLVLKGITSKYTTNEALSVPLDVLEVFLFYASSVVTAYGAGKSDSEIVKVAAEEVEQHFKKKYWEISNKEIIDLKSPLGNALIWRRVLTGQGEGVSTETAFHSLVAHLSEGKLPI